jgi:hypothetical protein
MQGKQNPVVELLQAEFQTQNAGKQPRADRRVETPRPTGLSPEPPEWKARGRVDAWVGSRSKSSAERNEPGEYVGWRQRTPGLCDESPICHGIGQQNANAAAKGKARFWFGCRGVQP